MGAWEEYDTVPTLGLQSLLDNQQLWHNQRNHIHWGENKIQEEIKRSRLALITKSSIKNNNKDSFWDAPAFLFSVKAGYASSLWLQPFPVVSVSVGAGSWGNKKRRTITRDDDVSVRDGNFSLIFLFFFLIITPTWVVASVSKALLSFLIWRWGFNKGEKNSVWPTSPLSCGSWKCIFINSYSEPCEQVWLRWRLLLHYTTCNALWKSTQRYVVVTVFLLHFTHCVTWNKSALMGEFTIRGCWGGFTGTICGTAM